MIWFGLVWFGIVWFGKGQIRFPSEFCRPRSSRKYFPGWVGGVGWVGWVVGKLGIKANLRSFGLDL